MEYISGNIFIRTQPPMAAGDVVVTHAHNFDHTTYCPVGALRVELLAEDGSVEASRDIRATDEVNFFLILKGKFHRLTALEDGTRYQCIYAHRMPQALTIPPGELDTPPHTKTDDLGYLWVRADNTIVQDPVGWVEAYQ